MFKYSKTIRRLLTTNCLSVFDHFVGLALKGLIYCAILENWKYFTHFVTFIVLKETFIHHGMYVPN